MRCEDGNRKGEEKLCLHCLDSDSRVDNFDVQASLVVFHFKTSASAPDLKLPYERALRTNIVKATSMLLSVL